MIDQADFSLLNFLPEVERKTSERKVVTPPCSTAGLMVTNALLVRSLLVPLNQIERSYVLGMGNLVRLGCVWLSDLGLND